MSTIRFHSKWNILKNDWVEKKHLGVSQPKIRKNESEPIKVLIAEAESELLFLFESYFASLGIRTETADSGTQTLDLFFDSKDHGKPYDAIVLDTHIYDPSGLEVAKRIHSQMPDQKLILVTTTPKEYLSKDCLKIAGIKDTDILPMPFKLSKLATALRD